MALRIRLDEYYDIVPGEGPGYRELIEAIFFPRANDIYGYKLAIKVGRSTLKVAVDIDVCARNGDSFGGRLRRITYGGERLWDPAPNDSDRGTHLEFKVQGYNPERRTGVLKLCNLRVNPGYTKPELFIS